jgi:hypothetical protein
MVAEGLLICQPAQRETVLCWPSRLEFRMEER